MAAVHAAHAASQESYRYDAAGRLVEATLGDKAIRYTYDAAGNVLERKVVPVPEPDVLAFLLAALAALRLPRSRAQAGGGVRTAETRGGAAPLELGPARLQRTHL